MRNNITVVCTILVTLLLGNGAFADEIVSKYGLVRAVEVQENSGSFVIQFDDIPLATINAEAVSLFRVTPTSQAKIEQIIVDKMIPGLNCRNEFHLLTIQQDKKAILSPAFGRCFELDKVENLGSGVKIKLHSAYIEGNTKMQYKTFVFENGKLVK